MAPNVWHFYISNNVCICSHRINTKHTYTCITYRYINTDSPMHWYQFCFAVVLFFFFHQRYWCVHWTVIINLFNRSIYIIIWFRFMLLAIVMSLCCYFKIVLIANKTDHWMGIILCHSKRGVAEGLNYCAQISDRVESAYRRGLLLECSFGFERKWTNPQM